MALSAGELSKWGRDCGERVVRFIQVEEPGTLIEYPLKPDEGPTLREFVRSLLPGTGWSGSDRACVAVYAVNLAASVDDAGYRSAFFSDLDRAEAGQLWESAYGSAIELFLIDQFDHAPVPGPYRYVGQIYRHAGITARGTKAFALFLRGLLRSSPTVLRTDYEIALDKVEASLIRPFLESQAGFEFSRQTAAFLAEHRHRGRSRDWLNGLSGYRSGFWEDFLDALNGEVPPPEAKRPPLPRLCLDLQEARLVLRFDPTWVSRGVYVLAGKRVRHPEHAVGGLQAPSVEIAAPTHSTNPVSPWWTPSVSPWALFRSSDGALVHVGGADEPEPTPLRPETYVFVGPEPLAPPGDDFGWLDVSEADGDAICAVRQFTLEPDTSIETLRVRGLSRERQLPSIAFDLGRGETGTGGVFYGTLPGIRILNWDARAAARYRIVHDMGERVSDVHIPPGSDRVVVDAACPGRGSIRLEYFGVDYGGRPLPTLTYTLLPPWARPVLLTANIGPLEHARVRLEPVDDRWRVSDTGGAVKDEAGDWLLPPGVQSWTPTLDGPAGFSATVRLEIPVWSVDLGLSLRASILTDCDLKALKAVPLVVRGRAWGRATVTIRGDHRSHTLLSQLDLGANGRRVMTLAGCLDQLETCPLTLGRIVVTIDDGRFHAQPLLWLRVGRLSEILSPFGEGEPGSLPSDWRSVLDAASPALTRSLDKLLGIRDNAVGSVELAVVDESVPALLPTAAGLCLMASTIDSTRCDRSEGELMDLWLAGRPAADDGLVQLREWWLNAEVTEPKVGLRVQRWEAMRVALRTARHMAVHLPTAVDEFKRAVLEHLPEVSPFEALAGHAELFHGAERYAAAMKLRGESRQVLLGRAGGLLTDAASLTPLRSPVHSIARILRTAVHIRRGLQLENGYFDDLTDAICGALTPAVEDLRRLSDGKAPAQGSGIRLAHISPADDDAAGA